MEWEIFMYRITIYGKEIIITLSPKIRKEITDRKQKY
ncbi:cytoplasmic protein, partial [Bacillus cereus]|nr:cytoplasmic protein [Bacillus cereus]